MWSRSTTSRPLAVADDVGGVDHQPGAGDRRRAGTTAGQQNVGLPKTSSAGTTPSRSSRCCAVEVARRARRGARPAGPRPAATAAQSVRWPDQRHRIDPPRPAGLVARRRGRRSSAPSPTSSRSAWRRRSSISAGPRRANTSTSWSHCSRGRAPLVGQLVVPAGLRSVGRWQRSRGRLGRLLSAIRRRRGGEEPRRRRCDRGSRRWRPGARRPTSWRRGGVEVRRRRRSARQPVGLARRTGSTARAAGQAPTPSSRPRTKQVDSDRGKRSSNRRKRRVGRRRHGLQGGAVEHLQRGQRAQHAHPPDVGEGGRARRGASRRLPARTSSTRVVMSARSTWTPRRWNSHASSRRIVPVRMPAMRWHSPMTRSRKRLRLRRATPSVWLAAT